jgi:hypothetical protein
MALNHTVINLLRTIFPLIIQIRPIRTLYLLNSVRELHTSTSKEITQSDVFSDIEGVTPFSDIVGLTPSGLRS